MQERNVEAKAPRVLVLGATGLVGSAAVRAWCDAGAEVVGASRRPAQIELPCSWLELDLLDRDACATALAGESFSHIVYSALYEEPELISGWRSERQIDTNSTMFDNVLSAIAGDCHVTLLQGTKAYGAHVEPMALPGRESSPRHEHENFYWRQEDLLRSKSERFAFTILRPQVVCGSAVGSPMNTLLALALYAHVEKSCGRPLRCVGSGGFVTELIDARLLARMIVWAGSSRAAAGETFNVTNGDVVHWPSFWPAFAALLGADYVDEVLSPNSLQQWSGDAENERAWQRLVEKHDLLPGSLAERAGSSFEFADAVLGCAGGATTLLSTVKLRKAGFHECIDSLDMCAELLSEMASNRLIPA
ncbi:MAG: NAD-dependent epimerase/dehydratase family protein [Pseudomonadaceae bacterium]|nr:NAD-dependent epimerase/dehydratase family protein [Pseudomonadaceae bacterium]